MLDAYLAQRWARPREVYIDVVCASGLPGPEGNWLLSLSEGLVVISIVILCAMRTGLPLLSYLDFSSK